MTLSLDTGKLLQLECGIAASCLWHTVCLHQWADGNTSTTDNVTAPATTAVYTANFTTTPGWTLQPSAGIDIDRQQRDLPVVWPAEHHRILD